MFRFYTLPIQTDEKRQKIKKNGEKDKKLIKSDKKIK